jgi:collagenase-like PrtC family protease
MNRRFAVGYQQNNVGELFADIVKDYAADIAEVYFAWPGQTSGRNALGSVRGRHNWDSQYLLEEDLRMFKQQGIKFDLLFNANCYGGRAVSQSLENEVLSILEHLDHCAGGVDIVTTTSLSIARTVKKYFPDIEVRASVNMRIGTIQAMEYVTGLFDSFYLQRDMQRDLEYVKHIRKWCDDNDKGLCLLANSGCLYCCPGQTFHDNMVAHDAEIDEMKNIENWTPFVCWNILRKEEMRKALLQSTWIRPEDLHNYDGLADVFKLATRLHSHPRMVLDAYTKESFNANLLDLLEPAYSSLLAPFYVDNKSFPIDWFNQTSKCGHNCETCAYCENTLKKVIKDSRKL